MKIEVGKTYITRSGEVATITHESHGGIFPFIGLLNGFKEEWKEDGGYYEEGNSRNDLVSEAPTPITPS